MGEILDVTPRPKKKFASVGEARMALRLDSLGAVYRTAKEVTVITATGTWVGTPAEWDGKGGRW